MSGLVRAGKLADMSGSVGSQRYHVWVSGSLLGRPLCRFDAPPPRGLTRQISFQFSIITGPYFKSYFHHPTSFQTASMVAILGQYHLLFLIHDALVRGTPEPPASPACSPSTARPRRSSLPHRRPTGVHTCLTALADRPTFCFGTAEIGAFCKPWIGRSFA